MRDEDCISLLQALLPRLGLKWSGYRKVRRTVCKRMRRRMRALGLVDLDDYRRLLAQSPDELALLDTFCRIPISRFYRDKAVFEALGTRLLPSLAEPAVTEGRQAIRCWSAGCASGEEVYSLRLLWDLSLQARHPDLQLTIIGTDAEAVMIDRARVACYPTASLKDAPAAWADQAFAPAGDRLCLKPAFRRDIAFLCEDLRKQQPDGPFDLILCRNLAFTYFDEAQQRRSLALIVQRLRPGGLLVLGAHEELPADGAALRRAAGALPIWRRAVEEGKITI